MTTTETVQLRRRMRILSHSASDESGMKSDLSNPEDAFESTTHESKQNGGENRIHAPPLPTKYHGDSDTSEDGSEGSSSRTPVRTQAPIMSPLSDSPPRRSSSSEQSRVERISQTRTHWYEFDISVVVALASPLGNWLTGGDHVKNVLLLLLLIFYLHQIIEIPWTLYNLSLPRRPARLSETASPSEQREQAAISSELRSLELFFLTLTIISPFLGAFILRYVSTFVLGADAISWFSTSLFILATGIRPWRHLIARLQERVADLHDQIHYPPPSLTASEDAQAKLDTMLHRIGDLEKALGRIKGKMSDLAEEMYDYVDEAVDGVEKTVRRHEKKCDVTRDSQEGHLAAIEASFEAWKRGSKHGGSAATGSTRAQMRRSSQPTQSGFLDWLWSFMSLPSLSDTPQSPSSTLRSPKPIASSKHHRHFSSSSSSPRLETIPEDVDFPFFHHSPPHSPTISRRGTNTTPAPSPSSSSLARTPPLLRIPGVNLALRCGDLATLPARTVVHYLLSARVGSSTLTTP